MELNWQLGRTSAFLPRENKRIVLSSAPILVNGNPYFPLKDAIAFIQGHIQTVPSENAVYFSESGYYNQLKLNLKPAKFIKEAKNRHDQSPQAKRHYAGAAQFLHEHLGLTFSYTSAAKTGKIQYSTWFTNNRPLKASSATLSVSVLGTGNFSMKAAGLAHLVHTAINRASLLKAITGENIACTRSAFLFYPGKMNSYTVTL